MCIYFGRAEKLMKIIPAVSPQPEFQIRSFIPIDPRIARWYLFKPKIPIWVNC
jgi:hypothetical protein